ncbi:MAG: hypothetical protein HKN74_11285 [Acidimicrobiia bacterium]|nr:hypothetical protein [Acidimicrobiia bacterium]MBT8217259.1 hypothetical protein [Acidimicrobiia bacterium]NNF10858.1 hypothetical protein [Acidimicrobiia bacterium]NNL71262.1 hypothetical protein [Acidimicrobiia bacterium]
MSNTTPERGAAHSPGKALYLSVGLAVLWVVLAFANPDTTFHLGAPLVAAAVALSHRTTGSGPLSPPAAAGAAVSGLTNALIATGILALNDKLEGGTLLPFGDATVETLLFAVGGAVVGFGVGVWGRR